MPPSRTDKSPKKRGVSGRSAGPLQPCPICGELKDPRGMSNHVKACTRINVRETAEKHAITQKRIADMLRQTEENLAIVNREAGGPSFSEGRGGTADSMLPIHALPATLSDDTDAAASGPIAAAVARARAAAAGTAQTAAVAAPPPTAAAVAVPPPTAAAVAAPPPTAAAVAAPPPTAAADLPHPPAAAAAAAGNSSADSPPSPSSSPPPPARDPQVDDIRREFHPNSGRESTTSPFDQFSRTIPSTFVPVADERPWRPFRSRLDFDFAALCAAAGLSQDQINNFIKFMWRFKRGEDQFSFNNSVDIQRTWQRAYDTLTPFVKHEISVPYKKEVIKHDVWSRDIWYWLRDLLLDPHLVSQMEFDAQRLSKYNGKEFRRFVDEPFTADKVWEVQSKIPSNAKPLALTLYANKTKLSSFGSAMGYPVVARCANLPTHIRNSRSKGGGRIVGWLPVVKEKASQKDDSAFPNYRRHVWHEGARVILQPIKGHSKHGVWLICGDAIQRQFYIFVVILAADYEEQGYMSLTRGVNSLFGSCPICLVAVDDLYDIFKEFERRTGPNMRLVLLEARSHKSMIEREEILQSFGLRDVDNAFLEIDNSDPYEALTFDKLHAFDLGLLGTHIWPLIKKCVDSLGAESADLLDKQFSLMPRWRGMNHFDSVMTISFSDGNKFVDLGKNLLFTIHNIIKPNTVNYQLCIILRHYLDLSMYLGFHLHTEDTIAAAKVCQDKLGRAIKAHHEDEASGKAWGFPKGHTYSHSLDDIMRKGAATEGDCRLGEGEHKSVKFSYQHSNFKGTDKQILERDHIRYVAQDIATKIDYTDECKRKEAEEEDRDEVIGDGQDAAALGRNAHFDMRSRIGPTTLSDIEAGHEDDEAFTNFSDKLAKYLTDLLRTPVTFKRLDKIMRYRLLEVFYESKVDWRQSSDYVRNHPMFHSRPRYDGILYNTINGPVFGEMVFMFTCVAGVASKYPVALVHPYDAALPQGAVNRKDRDFGYYRIKPKPRKSSEFIPVDSIIRGAMLVPCFGKKGEFLVHHLTDDDMYLRIREFQRR